MPTRSPRRSSRPRPTRIRCRPTEAELEARPEADNLVGIYAALADKTKAAVLGEFGGGQFSTFKKSLAELAVSRIAPVNAEMNRLLADPAEIDRILADGRAQGPGHRRAHRGRRSRISWASCARERVRAEFRHQELARLGARAGLLCGAANPVAA